MKAEVMKAEVMKAEVMKAEVLIAGAGPAGAAVALELARNGVAVTIVDRARFPRRKVCGEYLGDGALAAFERLGLARRIEALASPLRGVRVRAAGAAATTLEFSRPALAIERRELDAIVLDAARAAGAIHLTGQVEELVRGDGRVAGAIVRDESGALRTFESRVVVGADGLGSIIARKLALTRVGGGGRYAVGGHYRGMALADYVEMYVGEGAYLALNPLPMDTINLMLVVPRDRVRAWSGAIDAGIAGLAARLTEGRIELDSADRIGARVSIGPLAHRTKRAVVPGALLVGDAAGFVNPFTGQGVDLALFGAARAARAIQTALRRPHDEAAAFAAYDRELRAELRARRRLAALVELLVDVPFLARRAAERVARFPSAGTALLEALGGVAPAVGVWRPAVIGRLLL